MILLQVLDGGHLYAETNPANYIVEPWNAVSSLVIAMPAIYWAFRTFRQLNQYRFLWFCIPLLILNGLGSTFFHAFRSSGFFLIMDVLPAAILTLGVSIYFWNKVIHNIGVVAIIMVGAVILRYIGYAYFSLTVSTNISYLVAGIALFLPILIYLNKTKYYRANHIFYSMLCLIAALVFRTIDKLNLLPLSMGTHFLWHIFSGVGGYFLALYLYEIRTLELSQ